MGGDGEETRVGGREKVGVKKWGNEDGWECVEVGGLRMKQWIERGTAGMDGWVGGLD